MIAAKMPAPVSRRVEGSGVWLTVSVPVLRAFPVAV
jgi:hypothetical protein